ncbi:MAG: histidine kinase [Firmicutes bacterium]|nr:histidine kinase [Bacillota bacterium]
MPAINMIHLTLEIWGIIFCIIEAICVINGFKINEKKAKVVLWLIVADMLLLFCDSLSWYFRGVSDTMGLIMTRAGNFGTFIQSDVMVILFAEYIESIFGENTDKIEKRIITAVKIIAVIGVMLTVVSQFTNLLYYFDENNYYHRTKYHFLNLLTIILGLCGCMCLIVKKRRQMGKTHYFTFLFIVLAMLFSLVWLVSHYGIAFGNIAATISVMYIFTVHISERSAQFQKQQEKILRQKLEIEESKTALLSEIIKLHLINNSLALIMELCYEDSEKAAKTVESLSKYLHTGMAAMEKRTLLSLKEELNLLDNYLYIEQQRFPGIITVHKKINIWGILLPPMTIQPVVENAIRHGIRKRNTAGNIYISCDETKSEYIITVEDDGAGFDVNKLKEENNELHIGLDNVKKRLAFMVKGKLEIESVIGKGTKVTIHIPKSLSEGDK